MVKSCFEELLKEWRDFYQEHFNIIKQDINVFVINFIVKISKASMNYQGEVQYYSKFSKNQPIQNNANNFMSSNTDQ